MRAMVNKYGDGQFSISSKAASQWPPSPITLFQVVQCALILSQKPHSTLPLYLQCCWYRQSFGSGQSFPRYRRHPCECRSPRRGDSQPSPASSWKTTNTEGKLVVRQILPSHIPESCLKTVPYLGGLLGGNTGRGGRGGLSGRPASLSPSVGVSAVKPRPPEVLLPVEVFLRWVRSDRLEEHECSVL